MARFVRCLFVCVSPSLVFVCTWSVGWDVRGTSGSDTPPTVQCPWCVLRTLVSQCPLHSDSVAGGVSTKKQPHDRRRRAFAVIARSASAECVGTVTPELDTHLGFARRSEHRWAHCCAHHEAGRSTLYSCCFCVWEMGWVVCRALLYGIRLGKSSRRRTAMDTARSRAVR